MLPRAYWFICLASCEFGCAAQLDFSGLDAGLSTGGLPSFGDANSLGGSQTIGGTESQGGTWATGGTSEPCNDATCELPVVLAANLDIPSSIAVDSTYVYWTDQSSGDVKKIPLGGGTQITIASGQDGPEYVAVDHSYVYWMNVYTTGGGGAVMKAPLSGGTPITLASASDYPRALR